jgi:hypothetical protein
MANLKKTVGKIAKDALINEAAKKVQPALVNDLLDSKKPSKGKIVVVLGVISGLAAAAAQYLGG